ncbi:YdcF family protein [Kordiimonas aquimaris]|uniref:YdcF family protein n=1 Tax=Kordiimonas aquimaris TaxID=707591 RepID=UPI0021D080CF|nr:YdcF family protein [Kordiimonas aquimaris]
MTQNKIMRARTVLTAAAVIIGLWALGLLLFINSAQTPKTTEDKSSTNTTGIAVLTGGSGRLETGLQLLSNDKAQRLLISGVHTSVTIDDLIRLSGVEAEIFNCCVDIDRASTNTIENAVASASWVQKNNYTTLYLVTSAYHMPRSLMLFESKMPEITVIPIYVSTSLSFSAIIVEYNKYLFTSARLFL